MNRRRACESTAAQAIVFAGVFGRRKFNGGKRPLLSGKMISPSV
jgi:hypothetical protein